jgi:hypothetical protein
VISNKNGCRHLVYFRSTFVNKTFRLLKFSINHVPRLFPLRSYYKVDICFYVLDLEVIVPDVTSNVAVSDDKTQVGFTLPSVKPAEKSNIL